jgi:hypothetical protein
MKLTKLLSEIEVNKPNNKPLIFTMEYPKFNQGRLSLLKWEEGGVGAFLTRDSIMIYKISDLIPEAIEDLKPFGVISDNNMMIPLNKVHINKTVDEIKINKPGKPFTAKLIESDNDMMWEIYYLGSSIGVAYGDPQSSDIRLPLDELPEGNTSWMNFCYKESDTYEGYNFYIPTKLIKFETENIDETSMTGGEGVATKFAFSRKKLSEGYHSFKRSVVTRSPRSASNSMIRAVRRKINEIEKVINYSSKLKTEIGGDRISKEQLKELSIKLLELSRKIKSI